MKKLILFTLFTTFLYITKAQSVITIQRGSTTIFATTLDSAIYKAQNGDYIYLPGGLIATASSTITINKNLKFFGAGYNPDSSRATGISQITGDILFTTGSDSCMLTGISLSGGITIGSVTSNALYNITISRCNFGSLRQIVTLVNSFISENIIRNDINGNGSGLNGINVIFQKNIIYGAMGFMQGHTFSNNCFLRNALGSVLGTCYNNLFQNNIFLNPTQNFSVGVENNIVNNNLFVADSTAFNSQYNTGSGNIYNQIISSIFVNFVSGTQWNSSQNFHLKPGSAGIGKGTDGTDIGVYGSSSPFKEGGVPFNPHIQSAIIGSATNANGKLSINITVTAQNQ